MRRGLIIPALPFVPMIEHDFDGLADYQDAVGGYIEPVTISKPRLTLYCNEEGKGQRLPPNLRATVLWWLLEPDARGRDVIVGNSVLESEPEDHIAATFLHQLQAEQVFRVEVQTRSEAGTWTPSPMEFSTWFGAALYALQLEQEWSAVRDVRVSPV